MSAHSKIDGRYEIKEILGQGGMGIVYKAYDIQRKGYVALKTMKDTAEGAGLEMFDQEGRTLANISHPNIVDVLNSGEFEDDGQRKPYFVMPLLPGKTLDRLIREARHRLTVDRVVEIISQTCRGLQAAHLAGLIHRDLKPSNLFVMEDDSVKIIDFGMVHLADARKSVTGIKGTLQYMAPEQLELKEASPATDIFSLGVVTYEALTGRKPFDRGNEGATAHAIRTEFPPAISDINPAVNKALAQVVAKALAKGPWNRFSSAKEFADNLQRALKGDPIDAFDAAKIQPRIERARRALEEADFDYANEILNELQLEGHLESEITVLLEQVKQAARAKSVRQLIDSARTRLQEEEYPLAWQKVQEVLQTDPGNSEAQALQAEIETRRSDQQVENWRRLVHQHLHNNGFTQARQAIEQIRNVKRDDIEATELLAEVDRREKEFRKACEDKEQLFQSAMRSYGSGEISTALSKLGKVLELDGRVPGSVLPGRGQIYRETYNKIRSEWDSVQHAVAEIERLIASGELARASELSSEEGTKHPNDFGLQALRLKVEDLLRQEKSAFIAAIDRRIEAEPDLDHAVTYLEEALERYPKEPHFQELAGSLRKRRDLVNSIVGKARLYEEQNLPVEALGQWNTLRGIHPRYPGLDFEAERVRRRIEQHKREEAKLNWVDQIDRLLQTGEYDRAHELSIEALESFPGDHELQTLTRLALEGHDRTSEATKLTGQAQILCSERRFAEAIDLLRRAIGLAPNNALVRGSLADALAGEAQVLLVNDWRAAEPLLQEALQIAPAHVVAKSLRPSLLLAKRMECVDQCVAQARELQAAGDISAAVAKVQEGLASYPNDGRLMQLQKTLQNAIAEQASVRRKRDLEELRQLSKEVKQTRDQTSLTDLLDRSTVLTALYPDDREFSMVLSHIQQQAKAGGRGPTPAAGAQNGGFVPEDFQRAEAAPPKSTENAWTRFHNAVGLRFGRAWAWLAESGITLWAAAKRFAAVSRGKQLFAAVKNTRRAKPFWITLAAIPVVAIAIMGVVKGRKPAPPPPAQPGLSVRAVPVVFKVNPEGGSLIIDGKALAGTSRELTPGLHKVIAKKLGYKPSEREFNVTDSPSTQVLKLEPEPEVIRISADTSTGKVLLDGAPIGSLEDGSLSRQVAAPGKHTLKLMDGRNEIFGVAFQTEPGIPAQLLGPPSSRSIPVIAISYLGTRAQVQSSVPGMRVKLSNGAVQDVAAGREITLTPELNDVPFDDGARQMTVPVEMNNNAPVLSIRAGTPSKGRLTITVNVDNANVFIDGRKMRRPVTNGRWQSPADPGDHTVRIALEGYEEQPERKVAIVAGKTATEKFELKPAITTAFLRIEGGTPDAEVSLDGNAFGKLDSNGSLGPKPVSPDVDHTIRFHKENFEPSTDLKKRASAKQTINISGADARLKAFGTLVISDIQPPQALVSIRRSGETIRQASDKPLLLPEGPYTIHGTADDYDPFDKEVHVTSGQETTQAVVLVHKKPEVVQEVKRADIPELFSDSKNWKRDENGFWLRESTAYLKQPYFAHAFEVLKPKRRLGAGKVSWRTYTEGEDYILFELDDKHLSYRKYINNKAEEPVRLLHQAGRWDSTRLEIAVQPDHITVKVGQISPTISQKVEGRTTFDGRFGLKLLK